MSGIDDPELFSALNSALEKQEKKDKAADVLAEIEDIDRDAIRVNDAEAAEAILNDAPAHATRPEPDEADGDISKSYDDWEADS